MRLKVLSFLGKIDKTDYVRSAIFAALYAIMKDICIDLNDDKTLDFNLSSIKYIIIYFIISYIVSLCIFNLIKILSKHFIVENSETSFSLKSYFIATLRNLLFWMPYYILLFPGTSNIGDTNKQIQMFFHRPIKFPLNVSPVQGPDIYITDHHPLMTTVIYGSFVKLGVLLGHAYIGVAIFTLLQMTAFSLLFMWFMERLKQLGVNIIFIRLGMLFIALFPYFPLFTACMLKDVTFSFFCITTSILLFELRLSDGALFKKKWFVILLMLSILLFILSKGQGRYITAVLFVILLFTYRKYWLQVAITCVIPLLFFQIIWTNILLPAWNVSPGGKQEALGGLFQQTARVVTYYGDEITEEEKEAIDAILPYDSLSKRYDAVLTDPVKKKFNQNATSEQLNNYYKCWFSMFLKYPKLYIEATLNTSYKYFDLNWEETPVFTKFNMTVDENDEIYVKSFFTSDELGYKIINALNKIRKIPIIGLLIVPSFYTWLTIICFLAMIKKHNLKQLSVITIPLLSVLIYFICPGNLPRYTTPVILMTVTMLANMLYVKKEH